MNCGEKISELRRKHGMTQAELGEALNVTYQAVSKWERGESQPDFEMMSKIARLFGVSLGYFAGGENEAPQPAQIVYSYTETPAQTKMIGTCTECGKIVYENEECVTTPRLVCKACTERKNREAAQAYAAAARARAATEEQNRIEKQKAVKEELGRGFDVKLVISLIVALVSYVALTVITLLPSFSEDQMMYAAMTFFVPLALFGCTHAIGDFIKDLKDGSGDEDYTRNLSLIIATVFAILNMIVFLIIYLAAGDKNAFYLVLLGVGAVISFTFVSQFLWGGGIKELFTAGGFTFKLPGFIFSLSFDSILWMIIMKIFLGVVAAILFVVTTVIMAAIAILGSVFFFIPSLLHKTGKDQKAKKSLVTDPKSKQRVKTNNQAKQRVKK